MAVFIGGAESPSLELAEADAVTYRCKITSLGASSLQRGQAAPVTAADMHECSMEMLKLSQEFPGTRYVHTGEMFYITSGMAELVRSLQRDCWRKYENSISGL